MRPELCSYSPQQIDLIFKKYIIPCVVILKIMKVLGIKLLQVPTKVFASISDLGSYIPQLFFDILQSFLIVSNFSVTRNEFFGILFRLYLKKAINISWDSRQNLTTNCNAQQLFLLHDIQNMIVFQYLQKHQLSKSNHCIKQITIKHSDFLFIPVSSILGRMLSFCLFTDTTFL